MDCVEEKWEEIKEEKNQIINQWSNKDKEKITDFLDDLLKENIYNLGSEKKYGLNKKIDFGICSNHMYVFKGIKNIKSKYDKEKNYFYLWNPHCHNDDQEKLHHYKDIL